VTVLFVCSGNNRWGISPTIMSQGDSLEKLGINVEYFPVRGKGVAGYIQTVFRLKRFLHRNQFDLIHAHYGLCGWVAFLAKSNNPPLILSYMGSDLFLVRGGKVSKNGVLGKLNRMMQYRVDHLIVKSAAMAEGLSRPEITTVIPNGVDLDLFNPLPKEECRKELKLNLEKQIVLFLGNRSSPVKNFQLLETAIGIIKTPEIELLCPYPASPTLIPFYLNAADVLVQTSLSEGSPNIIKEAMACNCPIVATDVGDTQWVMGETEGCHITSFNPNDLANKIKSALTFGNRTNGRERLRMLGLDVDTVAKRIRHLYECLLYKEIVGESQISITSL